MGSGLIDGYGQREIRSNAGVEVFEVGGRVVSLKALPIGKADGWVRGNMEVGLLERQYARLEASVRAWESVSEGQASGGVALRDDEESGAASVTDDTAEPVRPNRNLVRFDDDGGDDAGASAGVDVEEDDEPGPFFESEGQLLDAFQRTKLAYFGAIRERVQAYLDAMGEKVDTLELTYGQIIDAFEVMTMLSDPTGVSVLSKIDAMTRRKQWMDGLTAGSGSSRAR